MATLTLFYPVDMTALPATGTSSEQGDLEHNFVRYVFPDDSLIALRGQFELNTSSGGLIGSGTIDGAILAPAGGLPSMIFTGLNFEVGSVYDTSNIAAGNFAQIVHDFLSGNDLIQGSSGDDVIIGYEGNDTIEGGAGEDWMIGGDGIDMGSYAHSKAGVVASLDISLNDLATGDAAGDSYYEDVENLQGTIFVDTIFGNAGNNLLQGLAGNDFIDGQNGGDTISGGLGSDTVSYYTSFAAVTASLANPAANKGFAKGDVYISIENLDGSIHGDVLAGNSQANIIRGSTYASDVDGNDYLSGLAGGDQLFGFDGRDTLDGGAGDDMLSGGLRGDRLFGRAGADTFTYGSAVQSGVKVAQRDVIMDFQPGVDQVDLYGIDAKAHVTGNNAFQFIGGAAFNAEGQVRAVAAGADTLLQINTSGAAGAEMTILLKGIDPDALDRGDFVL